MKNILPALLIFLVTAAVVAGFIYLEITSSKGIIERKDVDLEDTSLIQANEPTDENNQQVFILSLDGLADWILDNLLEHGHMPNMQRILANGIHAEYAYTTIPAKTAVGHSSIWTSTTPAFSGIHSNAIVPSPYYQQPCTETHSGFLSDGLLTEPIWTTVARQGKRAVVVQATQNSPFDPYIEGGRFYAPADKLVMADGYDFQIARPKVLNEDNSQILPALGWSNLPDHNGPLLETYESGKGFDFYYLIYDSPDVETVGYDSISIATARDGEKIVGTIHAADADYSTVEHWSNPVKVSSSHGGGFAYFRLFDLAEDGTTMTLFRSQIYCQRSTDPELQEELNRQGGFVGNDDGYSYAHELFGETVMANGDGSAEKAYLETMLLSNATTLRSIEIALQKEEWNLMIGYLANPDGINHTWLGLTAPDMGVNDFNTESPVWPYLLAGYQMIDKFVGKVYEALPDGATLVIVSDHGFTSVDSYFYPNTILEQAGLLVVDEDGKIDASKSKAIYFPGSGDFIFINEIGRFKDGIVPTNEVEEVKNEVKAALLAAQNENGEAIVRKVVTPEELDLHMEGPYAGDLYIILEEGYYNSGWSGKDVAVEKMKYPTGQHFGDPRRRAMNSICAFVKKGSRVESELGELPSIDIAPTVCSILSLEPPRDSLGQARREVVKAIIGAQ